ncbi:MAG: hypothetical protein PHP50_11040 [Lachnospiraceae bacterium]|nr:hypothetical protein [Lachnospiraceae bacterium]
MLNELSHIELSGIDFPMKMDNMVLQMIQKEYGNLKNFEIKLIGAAPVLDKNGMPVKNADGEIELKQQEPDISVTNFVLPKMIMEGWDIEGKEHEFTEEELIRLIDKNIYVMASLIHEEYARCILVKEPKKQKPNQSLQEKMQEKSRLTLIGCIISALRSWASQKKQ